MTIARTQSGAVRGRALDEVHEFLGIPYAAAPVGPLRWRAPEAPPDWAGTRDTIAFAPDSIASVPGPRGPAGQSEDSLYLNVWTPSVDPRAGRPVMVWIHGGGFIAGSASEPGYHGANLAREGVVVVSVNYRLGAFGFLAAPHAGANFAVLDWIRALRWVRANAAAFGGDPDNVTVFGQSAGAAAIRTLLQAPPARGLFHKAIIQSAGFDGPAHVEGPNADRVRQASGRLLRRLGAGTVEDARGFSAEDVRAASIAEAGIRPVPPRLHTPANLVWHPIPDGVIVEPELTAWAASIPVMIGRTSDEARYFVRPGSVYARPDLAPADAYTPEALAAMAEQLAGPQAGAILEHYRRTQPQEYPAIAALISEAIFDEPFLATLRHLDRAGFTVYSYVFERVSPGAEAAGMGAFHMAELPYVFGNLQPGGHDETDADVSRMVRRAWTSFAATGVPRRTDGTAWARYSSAAPVAEHLTSASRKLRPTRAATLLAGLRTA